MSISSVSQDYSPVITPLSPENILQGMVVHVGVNAVDEIVRRHDCPGVGLANSNLERTEVKFAKCSLRYQRIYRNSVRLLLVCDEVCIPLEKRNFGESV